MNVKGDFTPITFYFARSRNLPVFKEFRASGSSHRYVAWLYRSAEARFGIQHALAAVHSDHSRDPGPESTMRTQKLNAFIKGCVSQFAKGILLILVGSLVHCGCILPHNQCRIRKVRERLGPRQIEESPVCLMMRAEMPCPPHTSNKAQRWRNDRLCGDSNVIRHDWRSVPSSSKVAISREDSGAEI